MFFQPSVSLAKMRSARAPSDAKNQETQWRVVQKQCVSQIGICDNLEWFWFLFSKVLRYLGRHFGGLEGSWDHCRISMDFRTPQGTTQILSSAGVDGDYTVSGAQ